MMVCRYTRVENQWNRFNRFLCVIIIVARGNQAAAQTGEGDCDKAFRTCTGCLADLNEAKCQWDVSKQTCINAIAMHQKFVVANRSSCPRFSVEWRRQDEISSVKITISNDKTGFFSSVAKFKPIRCLLDSVSYVAEVADGRIKCTMEQADDMVDGHGGIVAAKLPMMHLSVVIDDNRAMLFDNVTDHYQYRYEKPVTNCPRCYWIDNQYVYYCNWCSGIDHSDASFQYCDKRRYLDLIPSKFGQTVKFIGDQCAAVRIESFNPTSGNWAVPTVLRIMVSNHETLLKTNTRSVGVNVMFYVRVAGRKCDIQKNAHTNNTITCTLSQPSKVTYATSEISKGPVEITYKGLLDIMLVSSENFTFFGNAIPSSTSLSPSSSPSSTPLPLSSSSSSTPTPPSSSPSSTSLSLSSSSSSTPTPPSSSPSSTSLPLSSSSSSTPTPPSSSPSSTPLPLSSSLSSTPTPPFSSSSSTPLPLSSSSSSTPTPPSSSPSSNLLPLSSSSSSTPTPPFSSSSSTPLPPSLSPSSTPTPPSSSPSSNLLPLSSSPSSTPTPPSSSPSSVPLPPSLSPSSVPSQTSSSPFSVSLPPSSSSSSIPLPPSSSPSSVPEIASPPHLPNQTSPQPSTMSQLTSSTPTPPSSSTQTPPPVPNLSSPLSSTLSPSPSPTALPTMNYPENVTTTKEALNNIFTLSRTASVLSTFVTIMMYILFIMVLCVALFCLKNPRTYDLLTFHLRQRPMEMRRLDEDQ